jgi:ankyrin repeat protein
MPDRNLPERPNLEQYKKQAKELLSDAAPGSPAEVRSAALARIRKYHPRLRTLPESTPISLADAQLVLAREHNFESWPKFAHHVETLRIIRSLEEVTDPVNTFIEFACVPIHGWHASGTLEHAEMILARHPHVAASSIYAAAVVADEPTVRAFLARDSSLATATGGPHQWDALTYLAFSRYLRLDKSRSDAFVSTARVLLDAGASANTGWINTVDDPPNEFQETVLYGAAGLAHNPGLTRLLLEHGADPNDGETCYHAPETYDNTVVEILLDSGRCNERSLAWLAARKADWHDEKGLALSLRHGANPNYRTQWKHTPFQHSIRRDNGLVMIEMFLDHGADPYLANEQDGRNALQMAAYHGRGDILAALERRGLALAFDGSTADLDQLVAACARADFARAQSLIAQKPRLQQQLLQIGGTILSRFSGVGNLEGVRTLLALGIPADALWPEGDPYFEITKNSTALHTAARRAQHAVVRELISAGAPISATDQRGRTALQLAVKACIDSYWKYRRQPDSVAALLAAGAPTEGIEIPTGYDAIDVLLTRTPS